MLNQEKWLDFFFFFTLNLECIYILKALEFCFRNYPVFFLNEMHKQHSLDKTRSCYSLLFVLPWNCSVCSLHFLIITKLYRFYFSVEKKYWSFKIREENFVVIVFALWFTQTISFEYIYCKNYSRDKVS